jgi:2-phosphosulfolactate phosphatase
MKISTYHRCEGIEARGVAVVIDVIRAFTTAAWAFHAGASRILTVGKIEEAFLHHTTNPHYLLMGESEGYLVDGFHYGNSPTQFSPKCLVGKTLVQRTSSGTQGVVGAIHADYILPSSFVVAQATIDRIRHLQPEEVSLIVTGRHDGSEDAALARYIEDSLLSGTTPDPTLYLDQVRNSPGGRRCLTQPDHPCCSLTDLEEVLKIDHFPFCLEIRKELEGLAMYPVRANGEAWNQP